MKKTDSLCSSGNIMNYFIVPKSNFAHHSINRMNFLDSSNTSYSLTILRCLTAHNRSISCRTRERVAALTLMYLAAKYLPVDLSLTLLTTPNLPLRKNKRNTLLAVLMEIGLLNLLFPKFMTHMTRLRSFLVDVKSKCSICYS